MLRFNAIFNSITTIYIYINHQKTNSCKIIQEKYTALYIFLEFLHASKEAKEPVLQFYMRKKKEPILE